METADVLCEDDLDLFAREATMLESVRQDAIHTLFAEKDEFVFDEDRGVGLGSYLGKPLPSTLSLEIEEQLGQGDDRVHRVSCSISEPDADRVVTFSIRIELEQAFLDIVLQMSPTELKVVP